MRRQQALVALVMLPVGCALGMAQDWGNGNKAMIEQQIAEMMGKLDALDERSRMQLISGVDRQRSELLGVLLRQLGTTNSNHVKAAAIYMIGRHRLSEGARELIRWIDFEPPPPARRGVAEPLWERYPAMEALIAIGHPSIGPTLELLATDDNFTRRDLGVKVIRYAEDSGVARFILERAAAGVSEPARQARLRDALTRLSKLPQ